MIFTETKLKGAYVIEPDKLEDERGFFARVWDKNEFEKCGLNSNLVQSSISFNKKKATTRGMHFQIKPYEETKIIRCTRGKIFDVMLDLRPNSPTFKMWFGVELNSNNYKACYIPNGFAHGFQTLVDDSEILYQISQYHMPEYSNGIPWNDNIINIKWPLTPSIMSKKDLSYPPFNERK